MVTTHINPIVYMGNHLRLQESLSMNCQVREAFLEVVTMVLGPSIDEEHDTSYW